MSLPLPQRPPAPLEGRRPAARRRFAPSTRAALLSFTLALAAFLWTSAAAAQEPAAPVEGLNTGDAELDKAYEDLMGFLDGGQWDFERLRSYLRRNFDSPEQLQSLYDRLPDAMRQQLEAQVELWSVEGGLGLGGGLRAPLAGEGGPGGVFRLSFSAGVVWPVGGFDLPIYYIFTDIPGPWALGFMGYAHTDNFNAATAGLNLRVALDYLGTSPFLEVGPAARATFRDGALAPGVHLDLGYGNILIQGFVQAEVFADDAQTLTLIAGLRIPWLLFTLF